MRRLKGPRQLCPFRWPGQYEDVETGLFYNRFRFYDPTAGTYASQDPLRLTVGLSLATYVHHRPHFSVALWEIRGGNGLMGYVADPLTSVDPLGLVRIHTERGIEVDAYPGPPAGGIEHLPLHAHVRDGSQTTRVLMEDYFKKGKLVGTLGDAYPGDPAMTKKMKEVLSSNLDELARKTDSDYHTGGC